MGFDAIYVPGWDCHGMPIEIQIEKKYGKNPSTAEVQSKARAYAAEQIALQKKENGVTPLLANVPKPPRNTWRREGLETS